MPQVDWQAYLDGSLSDEERIRAENLLESSDEARLELAGLKALRKGIRDQALLQPEPTTRLHGLLDTIVAGPRSKRRTYLVPAIAGLLILIAVIAWRVALHDPLRLDVTPIAATISSPSPQAAAEWVRENTGLPAPELQLGHEIWMARYGEGWACYDYRIEGQDLYLYMSRSDRFKDGDVWKTDVGTFYCGKGIGWRSGELSYYLRGGSAETRERLAKQLRRQLQS